MNVLIVNCCGLGDGLIELPYLKALEGALPRLRYHHTDGLVFQHPSFARLFQMDGFAGVVPARWRKFRGSDWADIGSFLVAHDIGIVINLRLLGPVHDSGYFAFQEHWGTRVRFLHYDFDDDAKHTSNIRERIESVFRDNGLIDHLVNPLTMRHIVPRVARTTQGRVGINMHTGNSLKEWPFEKWRTLCSRLLAEGSTLTVFGGYTDSESERSMTLSVELETICPGRTRLVSPFDLMTTLRHLDEVECLVTTDSWLLHAASGMGVRSVGLYIVTSSKVWGGTGSLCSALESPHLSRCEKYDGLLGICKNGYRKCALLNTEGDGITVEDVLKRIGRDTV